MLCCIHAHENHSFSLFVYHDSFHSFEKMKILNVDAAIFLNNVILFLKNQTSGLFGNWSLDINDDFKRPDGTFAPVDLNNFQSTHRDFAQHC